MTKSQKQIELSEAFLPLGFGIWSLGFDWDVAPWSLGFRAIGTHRSF
jgi:hypothetical protein